MLSRFIFKPSHLRRLTLISYQTHLSNPKPPSPPHHSPIPNPSFNFFCEASRHFSSNHWNNNNNNNNNSGDNLWKLSSENDQNIGSLFGDEENSAGSLQGIFGEGSKAAAEDQESWLSEPTGEQDIFKGIENKESSAGGMMIGPGAEEDGVEWATVGKSAEKAGDTDNEDDIFKGIEPGKGSVDGIIQDDGEWAMGDRHNEWDFAVDGKEKEEDLFDIGAGKSVEEKTMQGLVGDETTVGDSGKSEEEKQLESEEKALTAVLKGPNRAFGDLIAASGITEAMLDSLIALKDMEGVEGLPPLSEIEEIRYKKNTRKSTRAELELQKQEEVAKARVREVDDKGRAYGTGKRKCSIARVWIQPGDGKFLINDKQFDVYFPLLDHRAALLRPFSETKTLGLWDVSCTVKGGGVSGQVGAIQLGVSRALQNWEPDLRPPLKEVGFLTRDSRIVERKKPGKAKARKSFQWVKR